MVGFQYWLSIPWGLGSWFQPLTSSKASFYKPSNRWDSEAIEYKTAANIGLDHHTQGWQLFVATTPIHGTHEFFCILLSHFLPSSVYRYAPVLKFLMGVSDWSCSINVLSLSFLICKMGLIKMFILEGCCEVPANLLVSFQNIYA